MVAILVEVSEKDRERNYDELDALAASAGLVESANNRVLPSEYLKALNLSVIALSKYGNKVLFSEICNAESGYRRYAFREWDAMKTIMSELYAIWVDKDAIIARDDNLLSSPKTRIGWEDEFARATARVICDAGDIASTEDESLGYGYMNDKKIVAAFEVREETWYDEGFGTRDVAIKGYAVDVMISNGVFAKARYEGTISELMMSILSRAIS